MSTWYYTLDSQQMGPISEHELNSLKLSGTISHQTFIWKDGMASWLTYSEVFPAEPSKPQIPSKPDTSSGAADQSITQPTPAVSNTTQINTAECAVSGKVFPVSEMVQYGDEYVSAKHKEEFVQNLREGNQPVQSGQLPLNGYEYRDPKNMAMITTILFVLGVVFELSMYATGMFISPDPDIYGMAEQLILPLSGAYGITYIAGIVFYCIWKVRCAKNIRVFNNSNYEISPGWTVGYYFIPIVNLWKPLQAMKEIWRGSFNSPSEKESSLVGWWWAVWIISSIVSRVSSRLDYTAEPELVNIVDTILVVVSLPLLLLILRIIKKITKAQQEWASELKVN